MGVNKGKGSGEYRRMESCEMWVYKDEPNVPIRVDRLQEEQTMRVSIRKS